MMVSFSRNKGGFDFVFVLQVQEGYEQFGSVSCSKIRQASDFNTAAGQTAA